MKRRAKAIAAVRENPFQAALDSAKNLGTLAADFMYGTPERTRFTLYFAVGLALVGCLMSFESQALPVCAS